MTDRQRCCLGLVRGQSAERYFLAARRSDIHLSEELRILPELRGGPHHHVVLIQPRFFGFEQLTRLKPLLSQMRH